MQLHNRGFMRILEYPEAMPERIRRVLEHTVAGIDQDGTFTSAGVMPQTSPLIVRETVTIGDVADLVKSGGLEFLERDDCVFTVDIVWVDKSFNLVDGATRYRNVRLRQYGHMFAMFTAEDHARTELDVTPYHVLLRMTLERGVVIDQLKGIDPLKLSLQKAVRKRSE